MQTDMFESDIDRFAKELNELRTSLDSLRRGAFAQISSVRKDLESLASHCEIISDELFARNAAL